MSAPTCVADQLRWLLTAVIAGSVTLGLCAGLGAQSAEPREKPTLRETTIEEADLSGAKDIPSAANQGVTNSETDQPRGGKEDAVLPSETGEELALAEGEEGGLPLIARVTEKTTPQRAASLRLIEEGRKFLESGEYKQALGSFERAIAVDATNPYSHYFVARAHFFLGNYAESLNFLDVAESLLGWHKRWLSEISVLKGRNAAAMGFLGRADTNFLEALALDPYNRFAIERLTVIDQPAETVAPAP